MSKLNPTTNQRQWEHNAHTTHDKDKYNKAQKTKEMAQPEPYNKPETMQRKLKR